MRRTNRSIFAANQAVLHPLSQAVKATSLGRYMTGLHDLNANLKDRAYFRDDVLQGRFKAAITTIGRFITDSSIGIGGLSMSPPRRAPGKARFWPTLVRLGRQ